MASLPPFSWGTTLKAADVLAFCQRVAEFLRAVSKLRILDGQFLEVAFAATDTVNARHQLARPYAGALVVASTNPTTMTMVSVLTPAAAAAAGLDVSAYAAVRSEAAWTGTVTLWLF